MNKTKGIVDVVAMLLLVGAIVTGFMLHQEVWHLHVYDDTALWASHEAVGLVMAGMVAGHCVQHSFWFKNFAKIKPSRKRVTTILLILGVIVLGSGIPLMCGSHSGVISRIHYVCGILFTVFAIGHVAKRWKMLRSALKA